MFDKKSFLVRLRKVCKALPEVRETETFGNPTFQAGRKTFAVLDEYQGRPVLCFKTTAAEQYRLCEDGRFTEAPYGARHGWTCLELSGRPPWKELETLLENSYRLVALKRMLAALDGRS